MDEVKRYTATEVRFSTQGGSFVPASAFDGAERRNSELEGWVRKYRNVVASRRYADNDEGDMHQRADRIELDRLDATLKPTEQVSIDEQ